MWAYNNSAEQTLDRVLEKATGQAVVGYAERRLFGPLGMLHTAMATDKAGNAQMFEGIRSTCRDMARFGLLMLDQGRWGGRQIVSRSWVRQATGRSSTKLNAGYGYLWWLNRKGVLADVLSATSLQTVQRATRVGRIVPGAPSSMYWALGLGNQIVQVDPASKTVVVRLGNPNPLALKPTFGPAGTSEVVTQAVLRR